MSSNKQPTAKRTPSILVTDVRNSPYGGRPAPFVSRSGNGGAYKNARLRHGPRPQFEDISIDNILSDVGDIPSGHKRSVPKFMRVGNSGRSHAASRFASPGSPVAVVGGPGVGYNESISHQNFQSGSSQNAISSSISYSYGSGRNPSINVNKKTGPPPRLSQNIPSRTTKLSQKLVLIPENDRLSNFDDVDDEIEPPPAPYNKGDDRPKRSYAERLPRDSRTDKFPRVTAYCISDGMRLQAASDFLRENHKIRPRIYDEALFAPYYLPLLPGDGEGSRVKSSPGGIMMLEQLIDLSEQGDHHYEYFSGRETQPDEDIDENEMHHDDRGDIQPDAIQIKNKNSHSNTRLDQLRQENEEDLWQDNSPDFDPSEPQDFSPREHTSYMPTSISPTSLGPTRLQQHKHVGDLIDLDENAGNHNEPNSNLSEAHAYKQLEAESKRKLQSEHGSENQSEQFDSQSTLQSELYTQHEQQSHSHPHHEHHEHPQYHEQHEQHHEQHHDRHHDHHHEQPQSSSNQNSSPPELTSPRPKQRHLPNDDLKHAEIFIFSYGVIVFWNFTENQEKAILADLMYGKNGTKSLAVRPINDSDIETEEMHFTYSPNTMKPRIYNDMITLRSGDHMIKLAMSHAIAQSTKLSRFEARMDGNMHDVKHVPRMLALTGKLGMKREEVLKISGKLFKLRVDVNLSSNVLDTPEFFWESEPSLNPLYTAIREYLEIEQRILVLNERCKVFLELADIIADSIAEANMSRITWIIIILIVLSLGVSSLEIVLRFALFRKRSS